MKKDNEFFINRCRDLMKYFKPSAEDIKKIIELNDGLYHRFRMVYDDVVSMKKKIDLDIENGSLECSGYEIFPEYFFADEFFDDITDIDLLEQLGKLKYYLPNIELSENCEIPDFETEFMQHNELNWNIETLNLQGLEKHHIFYFMHMLFVDSDIFCVADIPNLKPQDLKWQITVQYEKFNK